MTFQKAWVNEKARIFQANRQLFQQIVAEISADHTDHIEERRKTLKPMEYDPMSLPSLQVLAAANAVFLRGSKKFTRNDMFDSKHAALAFHTVTRCFATEEWQRHFAIPRCHSGKRTIPKS
jgi:hypothetical protein